MEESEESKARPRHCLAERARQSLWPRTALRLLQLPFITTHGHVWERVILALDEGFLLRVSLAPQACACCVRDASSLVADRFSKTGLTFLGVTRTTCGSKGRAKVAVGVPKPSFRSFPRLLDSRLARGSGGDVLQSPPLRPSSTSCHHCEIRCEAGVPARQCRLRWDSRLATWIFETEVSRTL